ncbi:MAG: ribonuclease III [Bacteroidetes bacterium]|nr:ribonuclease III [Bacteroidota bacterium]
MIKSLFNSQKSNEELELIGFIIKKFGYRPKNLKYFLKAITHKSFKNQEFEFSNERLEFLGDAVLDSVVADYLFVKFQDQDEGYLTRIKSKIVNRKTLSDIGYSMGIRDILRYHQSRSINVTSLEGNAFEAILGAIYLDGGYEAVKKSVHNHLFRNFVNLNKLLEDEVDFKSKLFIWCQKKKWSLTFNVLKEFNSGVSWIYEVEVGINGKNYGKGEGSTKKLAEQEAAKETLRLLNEFL